VDRDEALTRLRGLGFGAGDAEMLWLHFDHAEQRGKQSHGHARIPWLESQSFDPIAEPRLVEDHEGFQRWDANGAVGYLVLGRVVAEQIARPPAHARVVVCERTFPTGVLGHHVRRLAEAGLVGLLAATSPKRLGPPDGPKLAGTNPLAVAVPGGVVTDVSMGAVTHGDVLAGLAKPEELVPFGGEQWHKALALALGLQLFVDALVREPGHGAVLVVARPESDPVPALRVLGVRLPGA
jgi:LDH2 family malate/lactate/ureidoglycolate dehydrogenase